eukprot:12430525-Alexandrium_andersonii.AAC.1
MAKTRAPWAESRAAAGGRPRWRRECMFHRITRNRTRSAAKSALHSGPRAPQRSTGLRPRLSPASTACSSA